MAMRAWLVIPEGGINLDGANWPKGPREITDVGWYRLLLSAGAVEISEKEFEDLKSAPTPGQVAARKRAEKAAKARKSEDGDGAAGADLGDQG